MERALEQRFATTCSRCSRAADELGAATGSGLGGGTGGRRGTNGVGERQLGRRGRRLRALG